jgi:hypothetical protein
MGEMGRLFREHMVLRGFAEATKESYEHALIDLVRAYEGTSPDQLTCEQVRPATSSIAPCWPWCMARGCASARCAGCGPATLKVRRTG